MQTTTSASQTWRGVMAVSVVTGSLGSSGRTIPVRIRNWPAVTISFMSMRRAVSCSQVRPVNSRTATTVVVTATHGGSAKATAPSR